MFPCENVRLNTKVTKTELRDGQWDVCVQESSHGGKQESKYEFDHVLVATGFFGQPKVPDTFKDVKPRARHSSEFRDIKDLITDGGKSVPTTGTKIYVVGGQMSGVEVAASVAYQLSSATYSPNRNGPPNEINYTVHHIVQRPLWIMPLFLPKDPVVEMAVGGEQQSKV